MGAGGDCCAVNRCFKLVALRPHRQRIEQACGPPMRPIQASRPMKKYAPLENHLRTLGTESVRMSFAEIEALVGELPASATGYGSSFWSNMEKENVHVQADAWKRAGWKTAGHSISGQYVDFERVERVKLPDEERSKNESSRSGADSNPHTGSEGDLDDWRLEDVDQMTAIAVRSGQPRFRANLLRLYGGTCPVTGSQVEPLLEAAHIVPYSVERSYRVTNGVPLRSDIHTLFDRHLLTIGPQGVIRVSRALLGTEYWQYDGQPMRVQPEDVNHRPGADALAYHNRLFDDQESTSHTVKAGLL